MNLYLRDTPSATLRASSQTPPIRPDSSGAIESLDKSDRQRGFAPLHSPFFSRLLDRSFEL